MLQILPRSRRHRRWLAAAAAAGATAALAPAAAHASDASLAFDQLTYSARSGETNNVRINAIDARTVILTDSVPIAGRDGCVNLSPTQVRCTRPDLIRTVVMNLSDGNDLLAMDRGTIDVVARGGPGNDVYLGATSASAQRVRFEGGLGSDTANYSRATSRVIVVKDASPHDGRSGLDRDTILPDVETLIGSSFNDSLIGTALSTEERFVGGAGNDFMDGLAGFATSDMGAAADGADTVEHDGGGAFIDYSRRTRPVTVTIGQGTRDDGEAGEADDIRQGNLILGGAAGDTLLGGNSAFDVFVDGGRGNDIIGGTARNDNLVGNAGSDIIAAGAGNDQIGARDGERDNINCGSDSDFVSRDSSETSVVGCEDDNVGVLRLSPKRLEAEVGDARTLRMSWSHPRSWRKLRSIEPRLRDQNRAIVGTVKISPRNTRVQATGPQLRLRSAGVRVTRPTAKRVTAAIRLHPTAAQAASRLSAEVEAVDTAGRRQVETQAATVRVPRG